MLENAWIIPLIPFVSFWLILLFGKRVGTTRAPFIGIAAVGAAFLLSAVVGVEWISRVQAASEGHEQPTVILEGGREKVIHASDAAAKSVAESTSPHAEAPDQEASSAHADEHKGGGGHKAASTGPVIRRWTWFAVGHREVTFGTMVDGLAAMMLFTVTLISLLVHVYSTEYLKGDRRYVHYFAFLSLFTASMLTLVLSENLLQLLLAWELVGVCSFTLIGHWWEEKKNTDAALKAFLTNRVGDTGLLIGISIIFITFGTFSIFEVNEATLAGEVGRGTLLIAALCLFAGVTSKSGQFPLHTWLPDAMAGPTPVSALIHAATMVVAGVFLVARLYPVFYEGLAIGESSLNYVAFIGGFTTVAGACLAFVQFDIKKVLAYSTISQLGYMVMALGVGAWTAGVFHLFTHAFFKACLFLGAGSVSHAAHHTFDMREMGGLRKHMPVTFWTFTISAAALAGLPPLAGFWSKDEILAGAFHGQEQGYPLVFAMGVVTALLTAAYMTRAWWMTFFGEFRGHGHPHESPRVMTVPLVVLGALAVTAGFVNIPGEIAGLEIPSAIAHRFQTWVEPTVAHPALEHAEFELSLAALSVAVALAGVAASWMFFTRQPSIAGLSRRNALAAAGRRFLENRYYLDTLYTDLVVGSIKGPIARASYWFNQRVLDGIVNASGEAAKRLGRFVYDVIDQRVVDGIVNGTGAVSEEAGEELRQVQTGRVQQYAAYLFGGTVVFAAILVIVV